MAVKLVATVDSLGPPDLQVPAAARAVTLETRVPAVKVAKLEVRAQPEMRARVVTRVQPEVRARVVTRALLEMQVPRALGVKPALPGLAV